jgi:hypothetical protein
LVSEPIADVVLVARVHQNTDAVGELVGNLVLEVVLHIAKISAVSVRFARESGHSTEGTTLGGRQAVQSNRMVISVMSE